MYSRMLLQIESNRRHIASLILNWVTLAIRPLTLEELAVAVNIETSASITTDQAIRDQVALCGSFLKIHECEVSLIHESARDHLLREEPDGNPVLEEYRIKPEQAHLELARTCLDYVQQSNLQYAAEYSYDSDDSRYGDDGDESDNTAHPQKSPLFNYAVRHSPEHARCSSTYADELFDPLRPFFHERSAVRMNRLEIYRHYRLRKNYDIQVLGRTCSLLHMAPFFGIVPWVQRLLVEHLENTVERPANKKDEHGRTHYFMLLWESARR